MVRRWHGQQGDQRANWVGNVKPIDSTDVAIFAGVVPGRANGSKSAEIDSNFTSTIGQIQILAGYQGTVTVANPLSVVDTVLQQGGTLSVAANQTLTSHGYQVVGGAIQGSGTVTIKGTAANPGGIVFSGPSATNIDSIIADSNSSITFAANVSFSSTVLQSHGTAYWTGGTVVLDSATFNNYGTFNVLCDSAMTTTLLGTFTNGGTVVKDQTAGVTSLGINLDNLAGGQLRVKTGTLSLRGNISTDSGIATVDFGATLALGAGTLLVGSSPSFTGAGLVQVSAILSVPNNTTVMFAAPLALTPGGSITGDIVPGGGTVYSTNNFWWSGGAVDGVKALNVSGVMLIDGAADKSLEDTTLISTAQAAWDGTGKIALTTATFENYGGFEIRNNAEMTDTAAGKNSSFFKNLGGLGNVTKTGLGFGTAFDIRFQTSGGLFLNGQGMRFTQGLSQIAGGNTVLDGGTLPIDAGQVYVLGAGTLVGGGTIAGAVGVINGWVDVGANQAQRALTVTGDYVQVGGTLAVHASADASWGLLAVGGDATVNGTLEVDLAGGYNPAAPFNKAILTAGGTRGGTFPNPFGWTVQPNPQDITVSKQVLIASSTWLSSNEGNTAPGQAVTFTATVFGGMVAPTGTLSFYDGDTLLGTVTLAPGMMGSTASFTTSGLALGSHQITAVYSGDDTCAASTSTPLTQTVQQAVTMTWASSSQNYSAPGQAVTFTAMVSGGMLGSPTGTVSFYDGTTLLSTVTLTPGMMGATASFTTSGLALGSHQITAVYSGEDTYAASTSTPLTQTVQQAVTMTWASSSQNYSAPGQAVTFTAMVSGMMGGAPTGTVSFYDGDVLLGTVTLTPGMMGTTASFTTSALASGSHQITAVYSGDDTFLGSTSSPLTQTVGP